MRIAPETVDRVREASDIVALVGEHVRLVKSGRSFKGLCPFHTEKTPSFMVNPERQTYHCFGCGAGGNAITFLIEYAKMSFPEAVRYLGERAGIEVVAAGDPAAETQTARLYEALAFAAELYRGALEDETGGRGAREYLARRGVDPALIEQFGLGFAPAGWSYLVDRAGRRFTADILLKAGLAVAKESGGSYDRFRNRVMVPILNPMGKVVGFGGRTLDPEENAKYINSPESAVYQKGQILFGLSQARDAMHREDEALVVEGYLDHLRVFGAGFPNVVAASGTAFTNQQAALLKRYAARAVLVFDGDEAGITASWRAVAPCLAAGLDVKLALLPPGHDPDSLIRDEGPDAFRRVVSGAIGPVEFAAVKIQPERGREAALQRFAEAVRECPDAIRRRSLIQAAAERFRFDEATLAQVVESKRPLAPSGSQARSRPVGEAAPDPVETGFITLLLTEPDGLEAASSLQEEDLQSATCREVLARLRADAHPSTWAQRLLEEEPATSLAHFVSKLLVEEGFSDIRAHVRKILQRRITHRIAYLREELKTAEASGDFEAVRAFLLEIKSLEAQKRAEHNTVSPSHHLAPVSGSGVTRVTGGETHDRSGT